MIENRNGKLPENHFLNYMNLIPSDSLKSICDDEIKKENQFQKNLLKSFEKRKSEYIIRKGRLVNLSHDFREIELVKAELNFCKNIIKKADEDNYLFDFYFSINKYNTFLEDRYRILTEPDFGILHQYEDLNSQEVVFLFLWLWKSNIFKFKNQSALSTYLESHCASSNGKLKGTNAIITKIKNNEIDLPHMHHYIERLNTSLKYIKF